MPLPPMQDKMQWPTQGYGPDPMQGPPGGDPIGNPRMMPPGRSPGMNDEQMREKLLKEAMIAELREMGIPLPGRDILQLPIEQFMKWMERRKMEEQLRQMQEQNQAAWSRNPPRPQAPPIGGGRGAL